MKTGSLPWKFLVLMLLLQCTVASQTTQNMKADIAGEQKGILIFPPAQESVAYVSRTFSLSFREVPIRDVLKEIAARMNLRITFSDDLLPVKKLITLSQANITVAQALDAVLEGTNVEWLAMSGGQIVLISKTTLEEETGRIVGIVKDSRTGEALPSANMIVEGTTKGAVTDADGKFVIERMLPGKYTLIARYVGYKKASQVATVEAGKDAKVEFSLEPTVLDLDEVIVTGMSVATEKRQLGNAISTLNASDLNLNGASSIDRALAGKLVGAQIQQNSGMPDGGVTVRLRGTATVLGSADPLYILDGVIINNDSPVLMFLGGYTQNRLMDIDPDDIERIEVVKGAAAAALYGSQANNGVVQIFTKHGSTGAPQVSFTTRMQLDGLRHRLDLNTATVDNNGNKNPDGSDVKRYDWQDFIFQDAVSTDQYLSISGGTSSTHYFASGSYTGNEGILKGTNFRRYNGRLNVDQILSSDINVSFDGNYAYSKSQEVPNGGLESSYGTLTGVLYGPNTVDPQKDPTTGLYPHNVGLTNPVEVIDLYDFHTDVSRFIGDAKLDVKLLPGLTGQYTLGYDTYKQTGIAFIPIGTARASVANGFSRKGTRDFFQITNDVSFHYLSQLSTDLRSTSLIGGTLQYQDASNFGVESSNLTPAVEIVTAGSIQTVNELRSQSVIYGAFAQESFTVADRLTLTAGLRLDASSVFGADERTQWYPKASISYLISDEPFWKESAIAAVVPSFKFRAAYGQSGGLTAIGPFDRYTSYNPTSLGGKAGVVPSTQLGAAGIKPERQRGYEIGADIGLLNQRLGLEFTYYNQHTTDLLLFRSVAPSSGYLNQLANVGTLDNNGIEFAARAIPISSKDFQWTTVFSYASNRNKVNGIQGGTLIIAESFGLVAAINGQPLGVYYGSAFQRDANGNIVTDANGIPQRAVDKKIIGDPNPRFTASWSNEFEIFQNVSVRTQFDAVYGNDVFNFSRRVQAFPAYGTSKDYQRELQGQLPKGYNAAVYNIFENWIEDGSYVKWREISVSYIFYPDIWNVRSMRVTLAGRNLLSFDKYGGYDPEVNVAGQRTAVRGFDFAEVPIPRSFSLGVTFNF